MSFDSTLQCTPREIVRFWAKVDRPTDGEACWLWMAYTTPDGYGRFMIGSRLGAFRTFGAHRLAYELVIGPIPHGKQIDHLCRVRHCCNPDHLEPVTSAENTRRGALHRVPPTHCPRGHDFDEYGYRPPGRSQVQCRECHRVANREYARRLRLSAKAAA